MNADKKSLDLLNDVKVCHSEICEVELDKEDSQYIDGNIIASGPIPCLVNIISKIEDYQSWLIS
jgi:hypothetical protein